MPERSIWIGYDPREAEAFAVARESIIRRLNLPIPVRGVVLDVLVEAKLYWREMRMKPTAEKPLLWDVISDAPMSTEFAISRFLVPHLAGKHGWALFMDCDMYARVNLAQVFDLCENDKAVMCVKHDYRPKSATKMDGQTQTQYARKNWSSFMLFNLEHPANEALTPELINTVPGRDLHRFCWLDDSEIGELDPCWNFLVGHSNPSIDPKVIHFTEGGPWMQGYENVPYADEWRSWRDKWAA